MKNTSEIPSPCFVLEEDKLIKNLELIDKVSTDAGVEIILAFKGFALWSSFPLFKKYTSGATASSLNEVLLCEEHMKTKAHTYCVAYSNDEFQEIVKRSSHITFNSLTQYQKLVDQVPENVSIGLRVNPEWSDVKIDLYNASSVESRLGVRSDELKELPKRVEGLHFHVLCESDSYALEKVLGNFTSRFGHLLDHVKWVNMGGGHLMTKEGYDLAHLTTTLKKFREKHNVHIILEPGSAFVWDTGFLRTTVLDIVKRNSKKTAIIDASFTCHMPDCLEMPYRPEINQASSTKTENGYPYRIGGVSCLAGDFLEEYWFDKELMVGDQINLKDMMHYTMVQTTTFNGIKHPSIGIQEVNGDFKLVKTFDYQDYKNRLS